MGEYQSYGIGNLVGAPTQCATPQRPTIRAQLDERAAWLQEQLQQVNEARDLLNSNPTLVRFYDLLRGIV